MEGPWGRAAVVSGNGHGGRSGNLQYPRQPLPPHRSHGVPVQEELHQRVPHPLRVRQRGLEEMAVAMINNAAYGKLLARALPRVIKTEEENERIVAELEKLDTRARPLTPEEENLAELMTLLVRQFEESRYPLGHAEPLEALRVLMEDRGLRQPDLIPDRK